MVRCLWASILKFGSCKPMDAICHGWLKISNCNTGAENSNTKLIPNSQSIATGKQFLTHRFRLSALVFSFGFSFE